ncbi:MAG: hypothetical protein NZ959_00300 [Armatimonadetes bacterium]|nr:hypothetical protein [Armatimonadota bacterium]MDW8120754.1 hypothetical protein [Armatimonadota bacterium]
MKGNWLIKGRQVLSLVMIVLGLVMIGRGAYHCYQASLGFWSLLQVVIVGGLVTLFGVVRWRFWRQRGDH